MLKIGTSNVLIIVYIISLVESVPPDYCLRPLNRSDCGMKPTPVISYFKPGSRCEIEYWRGCPTLNKFDNQYDCSHVCIYRYRIRSEEEEQHENITHSFENNDILSVPKAEKLKLKEILTNLPATVLSEIKEVIQTLQIKLDEKKLVLENQNSSITPLKVTTTVEIKPDTTTKPTAEIKTTTKTTAEINTTAKTTAKINITTIAAMTTKTIAKTTTATAAETRIEATTKSIAQTTTERIFQTTVKTTSESTIRTTVEPTTAKNTKFFADEVVIA